MDKLNLLREAVERKSEMSVGTEFSYSIDFVESTSRDGYLLYVIDIEGETFNPQEQIVYYEHGLIDAVADFICGDDYPLKSSVGLVDMEELYNDEDLWIECAERLGIEVPSYSVGDEVPLLDDSVEAMNLTDYVSDDGNCYAIIDAVYIDTDYRVQYKAQFGGMEFTLDEDDLI